MIRWQDIIALPVMLLLIVIQLAVLPHFPLLGVVPQLMFVAVLILAFIRGVESGVAWAFVAGLLVDIFSPAPLGSTSLVYMLVVLITVFFQRGLPSIGLAAPAFLAGIGTFVAIMLEYVILRIAGFHVDINISTAAAPLILVHALLIIPLYGGISWWQNKIQPRQVQL